MEIGFEPQSHQPSLDVIELWLAGSLSSVALAKEEEYRERIRLGFHHGVTDDTEKNKSWSWGYLER
jgi:hypothetical protein